MDKKLLVEGSSSSSAGLSPDHRNYQHQDWLFETYRSHILNSKCTSSFVCGKSRSLLLTDAEDRDKEDKSKTGTPRKTLEEYLKLKQKVYYERNLCHFCKYDLILSMAHLPDMTYVSNYLRLTHRPSDLVIEFNSLDALAPIVIKSYGLPVGLKVSASEAWLRARMNCEYTQNVCNADFDWTFSTDYGGTFLVRQNDKTIDLLENEERLRNRIESSDQRIDLEKLKIHKQIEFFDEVELFEDELADHGVAQCSVKIRVHPDCFYILCRFFLRVDRVFVRYFDTRIFHEFGADYLLRERSRHEATIDDLKLPATTANALLLDPQQLFSHMPVKDLIIDKIKLDVKV